MIPAVLLTWRLPSLWFWAASPSSSLFPSARPLSVYMSSSLVLVCSHLMPRPFALRAADRNKVIGGLEFLPHVPDYVYRYASFLFSFVGRGACKYWSSSLFPSADAEAWQSTFSLAASCYMTAFCDILPVPLSDLSALVMSCWSTSPRSSPRRTCASRTRRGEPSRSKLSA